MPDRWIFAGALSLLVWLPLPWGSNRPAAVALFGSVIALLAGVRLLLLARGTLRAAPLPGAARAALIVWCLWLAWITLQALPLPSAALALLSPRAHELHAALLALTGGAPRFSISIEPGATITQALLSLNYFCLFWLVLTAVRGNRSRQRLLLLTVMFSGVAQALYGVVMTLSGWEYGFLAQKQYGLGWVTGTFVNRNHMAGYLELTLSAGIALVLMDLRPRTASGWRQTLASLVDLALSPRMRTRVLLAVMVIALVMTRSRMGNAAFFSALMVCGSVYMLLRHRQSFLRSLVFFLSLLVVDLLIVSEYYGLKQLTDRIEQTDLDTEERTRVFAELRPVARDYLWTGAGLGSFSQAYAPYQSERVKGYWDHAHNDHYEFLIETGLPGYALLAALAGIVLAHGLLIVMRRRDPVACAIGFAGPMALICLLVHGLADFNLQIPAVAATLIALMGLTLSVSSKSQRNGLPGQSTDDSSPIVRAEIVS